MMKTRRRVGTSVTRNSEVNANDMLNAARQHAAKSPERGAFVSDLRNQQDDTLRWRDSGATWHQGRGLGE
jgi:hypothetical protein